MDEIRSNDQASWAHSLTDINPKNPRTKHCDLILSVSHVELMVVLQCKLHKADMRADSSTVVYITYGRNFQLMLLLWWAIQLARWWLGIMLTRRHALGSFWVRLAESFSLFIWVKANNPSVVLVKWKLRAAGTYRHYFNVVLISNLLIILYL